MRTSNQEEATWPGWKTGAFMNLGEEEVDGEYEHGHGHQPNGGEVPHVAGEQGEEPSLPSQVL